MPSLGSRLELIKSLTKIPTPEGLNVDLKFDRFEKVCNEE